MPQCGRCAGAYKTVAGLQKHYSASSCGGALQLGKRAFGKENGNSNERLTAGVKPGVSVKFPLPPRAGGKGRRRAVDNFVPVAAAAEGTGYWEQEEQNRDAGLDVREMLQRLFVEGGCNTGVDDEETTTQPSNGNATGAVVLPGDEDCETPADADHATPAQLRDAFLLLTRSITEKAGASLTNRMLRVVLQENFAEAAQLLTADGLDSVKRITDQVDADVADVMESRGFREVWAVNPDNTEEGICLYLRDALQVIKRQLERASVEQRNFHFQPWRGSSRTNGNTMRSHPMSSDLAHNVLGAVMDEIAHDPYDDEAYWDEHRSFMCFLQIYSDKSALGLSTKDHVFYPLHVAVLNQTSELKDATIRKGETVVAYMSTSSKWLPIPKGAERINISPAHADRSGIPAPFLDRYNPCDKGQDGKILYRTSIIAALSGIPRIAVRGLEFNDAEGTARLAHLVMVAISGDTPEQHLATCTKGGVCTRCFVNGTELSVPGLVRDMRHSYDTKNRLQEVRTSRRIRARDAAWAAGFSTTEPALWDWPFMGIEGLDLYQITRFDVMHAGPLGIFNHILKCLCKRLEDDELIGCVVKTAGSKELLKFSQLRVKVLGEMNAYIESIDEESPALGFSVNFTRGKKKSVLDGLFTDSGVASMLQAKDYRMAQEVLPFAATLLDRYLGDGDGSPEPNAVMTTMFVMYQELDQAIRRKDCEDTGFSDEAVTDLEDKREKMQSYMLQVLERFQKRNWALEKFHAYNHLAYDIRMLGVPSGFDTSAFESGHPIYKVAHRATARRHSSATAATTTILSRQEATRAKMISDAAATLDGRIVSELVNGKIHRNLTVPKSGLEAISGDSAVLARNGSKCSWRDLKDSLVRVIAGAEVVESVRKYPTKKKKALKEFFEQLGDFSVAHKALEIIRGLAVASDLGGDNGEGTALHDRFLLNTVTLTVVKSAKIAGMAVPGLSQLDDNGVVSVMDNGYRMFQRAISCAKFSHGRRQFQDSVMIEGDTSEGESTNNVELGAETKELRRVEVWFAKVLAFVRLQASSGPLADEDPENLEYAIVQYYEVIGLEHLDGVDIATKCIKLQWARDQMQESEGGSDSDTESQPWVDVVRVSSIRGRVHILREPKINLGDETDTGWASQTFYVNKYKLSNYEATYNTADVMNN